MLFLNIQVRADQGPDLLFFKKRNILAVSFGSRPVLLDLKRKRKEKKKGPQK